MTEEELEFYFYWGSAFSYLCSTISVVIHLYKFWRSESPQSFATRCLTYYCTLLFFVYLSILFKRIYETQETILIVLIISLAVFLFQFLIAIDACVCFRNIALFVPQRNDLNDEKFVVYCVLGSVASVVCILLIVINSLFFHVPLVAVTEPNYLILTIINIVRLIPFLLSFWYIWKASFSKGEFWTKFSMHIRLIAMMGIVSSIVAVSKLTLFIYVHGGTEILYQWYMWYYNEFTVDGILVVACFTFKKDTFRCVDATSIDSSKSRKLEKSRSETYTLSRQILTSFGSSDASISTIAL